MNLKVGAFLSSSATLADVNFTNSLLLITEYNENGAMGMVTNKIFTRTLNELAEFSHCLPFPLYDGGPVGKEHLYFMHRRPDKIEDGNLIADNVYFGGDFKQALHHINNKTLTQKDIKYLSVIAVGMQAN